MIKGADVIAKARYSKCMIHLRCAAWTRLLHYVFTKGRVECLSACHQCERCFATPQTIGASLRLKPLVLRYASNHWCFATPQTIGTVLGPRHRPVLPIVGPNLATTSKPAHVRLDNTAHDMTAGPYEWQPHLERRIVGINLIAVTPVLQLGARHYWREPVALSRFQRLCTRQDKSTPR